MLTLEIFRGLNEITHIKHLDLYQTHEAHTVKNNEGYAESYGMAVSLSQKQWPAAWARQQLLLRAKSGGGGSPGKGWGRRAGIYWATQRHVPFRTNGSVASMHTMGVSTEGKDSAHGKRVLFRPRENLKYGDLWLLGMWARKCTNLKSRQGHGIILYLVTIKLTLHERRGWFRIHFRGGKCLKP